MGSGRCRSAWIQQNPLLRPGEGKGQQGEKIRYQARGW